MQEEHADSGLLVTTGKFSSPAMEYGRKHNIELIGQEKILSLMRQAYPNIDADVTFELMCEQCGDLVLFKLEEASADKKCCNGHLIRRLI